MPSEKSSRASAPKRSTEGASRRPHPSVTLPEGVAGNVIWLGGLTMVAALGVVDWPVVALVAAGAWVAEQHIKQSRRPQPAQA